MRRFLITALVIFNTVGVLNGKQMQPDAKRVHEIAVALAAHDFSIREDAKWPEVQSLCRRIAGEHGWQTHHAPDARVLILIGLGNKHSDPDVVTGKLLHPELDQ